MSCWCGGWSPRPWHLEWQDQQKLQADIEASKFDERDSRQKLHPLNLEFVSKITR
jgi:hypothetical protein